MADIRQRRWLLALPLALLLLGILLSTSSGCSGLLGSKVKLRPQRTFKLAVEPRRLNTPESQRPYAFKVEVGEFGVSRLFDSNQIVFRLSAEKIKNDDEHRWAVRPSRMITDAVEQYVEDARLFTVLSQNLDDPDYTLTGTIKAIERVDSGNLWYAHLDMSIQLLDRVNQVVWARDFNREPEQVYQNTTVPL